MRFNEFRLPFAGVLLLVASALTFAFATNGAGESPATAQRSTIVAPPSVAVVRRGDDGRRAVPPAFARPVAAHTVAARAVPARGRSRRHVWSRPQPRAASVAVAPVRSTVAMAAPKRAVLHGPAIAWQPFSIVRFVGSKRAIARGDSVTLCARAIGAARLRIVPLGPVDPRRRTCRVVRPRQSTTYTLLAQGPGGGEMTQNVTIAVHKRPRPRPAPTPAALSPGP
jgi:hypothetical protein